MINLRTLLEGLSDKPHILTVQPGGNYGDNLIYKGFRKILSKSDIRSTPLKDGKMRNDTPIDILQPNQNALLGVRSQARYLKHRLTTNYDAVYIHGGGNFSEVDARNKRSRIPSSRSSELGSGIECFKMVVKLFDCPIIVGPQSCAFDRIDPSKLFENVSNEVVLYCREKYSYDIMVDATTHYENVQVGLAEDTAFHLTPDDLPISGVAEDYTLLAFRNDAESLLPRLDPNFETSLISRDISKGEPNFEEFVRRVSEADKIYTDRLHVAILSIILDKEVIFYDNAYHKNRGVYEYSFSEKSKISFEKLY